MRAHGDFRRVGILRSKRFDDGFMGDDGKRNAIVVLHEISPIGVGMGVGLAGKSCENRIGRGCKDDLMKLPIRNLETDGVVAEFALGFDQFGEAVQRCLVNPGGGKPGESWLQDEARAEDVLIGLVGDGMNFMG